LTGRCDSARAVLRDRAGRDVDVELALLKRIVWDRDVVGVAADVGERDSR
jgi:hypothetical protein